MCDLPLPTASHPHLLITDFDGTLTRRDFYRCAFERLPSEASAIWARYEAGELTHFEALRDMFALLPGEEGALMAIARETGLEADVAAELERLLEAGWQTVVVSAGSSWYIRRLFQERGLRLPVISNEGEAIPGRGLQIRRLPHDSPFYSEAVGVDKAAVVRTALDRFRSVAFAGDSLPDRAAAELVSSDRRFARGWLANHFEREQVPFRRFGHWADIGAMLRSAPDQIARRSNRGGPPLGR
jgi:HAD superfamily phosphoserine phosphatase-like hydrolase